MAFHSGFLAVKPEWKSGFQLCTSGNYTLLGGKIRFGRNFGIGIPVDTNMQLNCMLS